jgi:hypothetical protein
MKRDKVTTIGDNLAVVFGRQPWGNQRHLFPLVRHWPEIVGEDAAAYSMPAYFRRDVLWVYVQDSIWMQQMQMMKLDLLTAINAFLRRQQPVQDLRWKQYPRELLERQVEEYVSPPIDVDPAAEKEFRLMAENIADAGAREALCKLWLLLSSKNRQQQDEI